MRITSLLRAAHYEPMIRFIGQRSKIHHEPHAPSPHPAAPPEIVSTFQQFLAKLQSSSGGASNPSSTPKGQSVNASSKGEIGGREAENSRGSNKSSSGELKVVDYENFWDAPSYLWRTKEVSEKEMEAVMSGGATDIRTGA